MRKNREETDNLAAAGAEKKRISWKVIIPLILAGLAALYFLLVYFLVSACLVPSFMEKLDAFEEITEKSYAEQVQTSDIRDNRSAALSETKLWLQEVNMQKLTVQTEDGYTLVASEFLPETGDEQEDAGEQESEQKSGQEDGREQENAQIATASHKWVLLLHGYTGWKEEMYEFAYWYYQQGYHILVPDLRCQGESQGDFIGMGWTDASDCSLWIDEILKQDPEAEIVVHGQSMGAATALIMTGQPETAEHIRAVISDCAYTDAYSMFGEKITEWFHLPAFPLVDSAVWMLKLRGGYDLRKASAINAVKVSSTPTLFIHGDQDAMISVDMAYELYDAAACPRQLLIVEGAGHAQSQDKDPEKYYDTISLFLEEYLNE